MSAQIQGDGVESRSDSSTNTKAEMTKAAILEQAQEFLWAHQFRDLSVNRLMELLPIGRSAFYQYFSDIHELMESLLLDFEQGVLTIANPWLGDEPDPPTALRSMLVSLTQYCHERGPIMRAVQEASVSDPKVEAVWNTFLGRLDDAVEAKILLDQERGIIRGLDARSVAVALNRMHAFTMINAFGHRPGKSVETLIDTVSAVWVGTLYPESVGKIEK